MSAFEYCFSTLGCPEINLHQVAGLADRHGIAAVELRTLSATVDLISALVAEFETPAGLAAFRTGYNLRIVALSTSVKLFGTSDLSAVEPFIPWAEAAGVSYLRIFDGGKYIDADAMTRAADLLNDWQDVRKRRGINVDVMIETHDALADSGQLASFVEQVPKANMLWDTHHTWAKGEKLDAVWSRICANVVHLHVKDSKIGSDGRRHYVLPGQGDFPIGDLIALLRADSRRLPLSLEWERHWHPELPPLDKALKTARPWWQKGVF